MTVADDDYQDPWEITTEPEDVGDDYQDPAVERLTARAELLEAEIERMKAQNVDLLDWEIRYGREVERLKTENTDLRAIITSMWDGEWGSDVGPQMTPKQAALCDDIIDKFRKTYDV